MEDFYSIGERAAKAIRDRAKENNTTFGAELKKLNIFQYAVTEWEKKGYAPSAHYLQKMCLAGYDVIYILTGERKHEE